MMNCLYCFSPLHQSGVGRLPVYCSSACRQAAYRFRKSGFHRIRVSASLRSLSLRNAGRTVSYLNQTDL